jgi:hypothetical protein
MPKLKLCARSRTSRSRHASSPSPAYADNREQPLNFGSPKFIYTHKALLEDPKLGTPVLLPEPLYLEILVGQMSAQETTVFDCPAIGDNLLAKDLQGRYKYTLDKVKRAIDDCSNPPYFRGVKTPITDLLDLAEPKISYQGEEGSNQGEERQGFLQNTSRQTQRQIPPYSPARP